MTATCLNDVGTFEQVFGRCALWAYDGAEAKRLPALEPCRDQGFRLWLCLGEVNARL